MQSWFSWIPWLVHEIGQVFSEKYRSSTTMDWSALVSPKLSKLEVTWPMVFRMWLPTFDHPMSCWWIVNQSSHELLVIGDFFFGGTPNLISPMFSPFFQPESLQKTKLLNDSYHSFNSKKARSEAQWSKEISRSTWWADGTGRRAKASFWGV